MQFPEKKLSENAISWKKVVGNVLPTLFQSGGKHGF
jgi:hypothetical protein